jgi:23S rRNA U2552 (ribose-2'-O)-methylase RlmE/FtsJ
MAHVSRSYPCNTECKPMFEFAELSEPSKDEDVLEQVFVVMHELSLMHDELTICKDQIASHRKWDQYKKYTNSFESIYSPSFQCIGVSSYSPVSRSFFKLWEILLDYESEFGFVTKPYSVKCAFLAEGPGGFMEAIAKYRHDYVCRRGGGDAVNLNDEYHGITLLSRSKSIPSWKLSPVRQFASNSSSKVCIHSGVDGTGNLYSVRNIDKFVEDLQPKCSSQIPHYEYSMQGSMDLVTADGGFDFSRNFNDQEERALLLIIAEVYTAIRLQRLGGALILKIYDIHTLSIVKVLFFLRKVYTRVHLTKPYTSRPANSEKYVVCTGFKGLIYTHIPTYDLQSISDMDHMRCYLLAMENDDVEINVDTNFMSMLHLPNVSFVKDLIRMTTNFVHRQVNAINDVICLLRECDITDKRDGDGGDKHKKGTHFQLPHTSKYNCKRPSTSGPRMFNDNWVQSSDSFQKNNAIHKRVQISIKKSINWCSHYNIAIHKSVLGE